MTWRAVPVFPTSDMDASIRFYVEKLGMTLRFQMDGDEPYAGLARDGFELHLFACADRKIAEWTACRCEVPDVDALHAELAPRGVIHPNGPLRDQPWGTREFVVLEPGGCAVTFFSRPA